MSLIPIGGSDLTMFHTCLSAWERRTTLVRIPAVNKIHPSGLLQRVLVCIVGRELANREKAVEAFVI
jgi:hypothetical protein